MSAIASMHSEFQLPREVSPSIDPRIIEGEDTDPDVSAARNALRVAREVCERALASSSATLANEMLMPAARHRQAKKDAWAITANGIRALQAVVERNQKLTRELESVTHSPSRTNDAVSAIRSNGVSAALRELPYGRRREVVVEAIKAGDDDTMQAVLDLPSFMTGFDLSDGEELRELWRRTRLPDECSRLDRLRSQTDHILRAGRLMQSFIVRLYAPAVVGMGEKLEAESERLRANRP